MRRLILLVSFLACSAFANTEIAPNVVFIQGSFVPGTQPDGNSIVFKASKGLIVVDTGRHPEHTQAILDFAKDAHQPIAAVINTHWHLDHVGGNPVVRREFPAVRIYATSAIDAALKGFLADYRAQLADMLTKTTKPEEQKTWQAEMAIIDSGRALAPDEVVSKSGRKTIAGRKLELHVEHGATAGDLWLFDPATRVVVAGDLVTLPVPFLDTACPSRWKDALDHLSQSDFSVLVPGHGAPMKRQEFETYRKAFSNLLECAASSRTREECVAGWMTDAASFLTDAKPGWVKSMVAYYVDTQLRGDPAMLAKRCAN